MAATLVFYPGIFDELHQIYRVMECMDPLFENTIFLQYIPFVDRTTLRSFLLRVWMFVCLLWEGRVDFGQEYDVSLLRKEPPSDIAFGISRGAATTFSRWAHADVLETRPKLVVLEGCPDSIGNVLNYRYGKWVGGLVESLLTRSTRYRADGMSALASASVFPLDLPVAFVTSEKDTSVPASGTYAIVNALRSRGHQHVHLLVLKDAHHNNYYTASKRDRTAYQTFVRTLQDLYVRA